MSKVVQITASIITLLLVTSLLCSQSLVINEIMSDNETVLRDYQEDYPDWIELYNASATAIDLNKFYLSDDKDDFLRWQLPNVILEPSAYILIFASGKNQKLQNEYHTNFKISSAGEKLYLSNQQGVVDQFNPFSLDDDVSAGRIKDNETQKLSVPTPGSENILYNNELSFSKESGCYQNAFELQIDASELDTIFYSLDGSLPAGSGKILEGPLYIKSIDDLSLSISIIPNTPTQKEIAFKAWELPSGALPQLHTLRFQSYKNGQPTSPVYTQVYLIGHSFTEWFEIPVISIVTDKQGLHDETDGIFVPGIDFDASDPEWTGNYFRKGWDSERAISISYFDNNQLLFSQNAGLRINGQKTRQATQKSLRILARPKYGEGVIQHKLIPESKKDSMHSFVLRTTMGSWYGNTIIKDELIQRICAEMDFESMASNPVVVYINGEYWGMYSLRDNINEDHLAQINNLDKRDIEMWDWYNEHYYDMVDYAKNNDLSQNQHYEHLKTQIDINNFIDYQVAQIFFQNTDWPSNNNVFWRPYTEDGKWRWIFFDLDGSMPEGDVNILDRAINAPTTNQVTVLFRHLLENENFRNRFLSKYEYHIDNTFKPSRMFSIFWKMTDMYRRHLPQHIDRWNFPSSIEGWEETLDESIINFFNTRHCKAKEELANYFLLEDSWLCHTSDELEDLSIYPNPTEDVFYIDKKSAGELLVDLRIYNAQGKLFVNKENVILSAFNRFQVNQSLETGTYMIQIVANENVMTHKLVVLK